MTVSCFLDTNVILYAVSPRGGEVTKYLKAFEILEGARFVTSAQVLQEFFVNATRKIPKPLSIFEATVWIEKLALRPVVSITQGLVASAISTSTRYQTSYWDGAIIAAAEQAGAPILYSEDLNHGQLYGSVRVVNPFKAN
jgi:predicted nucleic acid-binding protein